VVRIFRECMSQLAVTYVVLIRTDLSSVRGLMCITVRHLSSFLRISAKYHLRHSDLLDQNGGLNALGEIYVGARTIHTQVVTAPPTSAYKTFNGADNPTQLPATSWAPLPNSAASPWASNNAVLLTPLAAALLASIVGGLGIFLPAL